MCPPGCELPPVLPSRLFREASFQDSIEGSGGSRSEQDDDEANGSLVGGLNAPAAEEAPGLGYAPPSEPAVFAGGDVRVGASNRNNSTPFASSSMLISKHKERLNKGYRRNGAPLPRLRIFQALHPVLYFRGRLFGGRPPRLKDAWEEIDSPYYSAAGEVLRYVERIDVREDRCTRG